MTWIVKVCKHLTLVLVLFAFLAIAGCEGTDTREKVDDTVEELAGKKNLDRMDKMKKNINKAQQQQADRYKKIDESAEEK
jgi:outer membrane murein-binding lipoprotein Lpp